LTQLVYIYCSRNMTSLDQEWLSYVCSHRMGKEFSGGAMVMGGVEGVANANVSGEKKDKDKKKAAPFLSSTSTSTPTSVSTTAPSPIDLIISTKTKVLFLNQPIDIHSLFWRIPVTDYWMPVTGVLKKQIKIVSKTPEEYQQYRERLVGIRYYKEHVIKQIDNPTARSIKFKDERKLTVGLSRKDIMAYRIKLKNAFYNCFALVLRVMLEEDSKEVDTRFREVHVKVFNTGKMEIPGIVDYRILNAVKTAIMDLLRPMLDVAVLPRPLEFIENSHEDHVLINSNFNCGYYIHREKLYVILKNEPYHIDSSYDPCTYPGVKCKFYFNHDLGFDPERQNGRILREDRSMKMCELDTSKKYTEVSFMIFRTGSGLIVGNCTEKVLRFVFEFIKDILVREQAHICIANEIPAVKPKTTAIRPRHVWFDAQATL
jgi:hypothetical protein